MKTYLFNNPESISEHQLEHELLPQLPLWRKKEVLRYKHLAGRVLSALAFILLKEGLRKDFGIEEELSFDYGKQGKPTLHNHQEIHFNLSHCKRGVLCVIDTTAPVGCDIEVTGRKISDALMLRCCNEAELEAIRQAETPNEAFIRLWTVKEAVVKYLGESIVSDLPNLLRPTLLETLEINTLSCPSEGYIYSTCQKKQRVSLS